MACCCWRTLLVVGVVVLVTALLPDTNSLFGFDIDIQHRRKLSLPESFSGPLLTNQLLSKADKLFVNEITGPESFAVWNGHLYSSLADGRIVEILPDSYRTVVRIDPHDHGAEQCGRLYNSPHCSRPLGLKFDSTGTLYTVDPNFGLFAINVTTGQYRLLKAREALDNAIFLDDLVVYEKPNSVHKVFYMTDLSTRWPIEDVVAIIAETEQTGRLLSWDTETDRVQVVIDSLPAPNGVELTADRTAILLASFTDRLLYRFTIVGDQKGKLQVLVDNLPGEPDNIHRSQNPNRETYWVALYTGRSARMPPNAIDRLANRNSFVVRLLLRLQRTIGYLIENAAVFLQNEPLMDLGFGVRSLQWSSPFVCDYGLAIEVDGNTGEIVNSLHSPDGNICALSEVVELPPTERERRFYLGSAFNRYLGRLTLPNTDFRDSSEEHNLSKQTTEKQTSTTERTNTAPHTTTQPQNPKASTIKQTDYKHTQQQSRSKQEL